jgi:alanine racemase
MAKPTARRDQKYSVNEKIAKLRPAFLEIDLDAFNDNFRKVKSLLEPDVAVMAVVKANAYGHGLIRMGLQAEKCGADFLGVALIEEGEKLINAGIKIPVVVLYPDTPERALRLARAGLVATVASVDYLDALNIAAESTGKTIRVFLKVETGMGRYGMSPSELETIVNLANNMPSIEIIGVSTNLASSSCESAVFTNMQFDRFDNAKKTIDLDCNCHYSSVESSGGLLFHHRRDFNMVRIGLLFYGLSPNGKQLPGLKPILYLKSQIVQLKSWPAGKPVGYGGNFIPTRNIVLATVSVGYADGYPWSLSNKSWLLIHGKRAPVVGKICMDALMIDVTDIPGVKIGDEVTLLGKQGDEIITVEQLANLAGSFSYEFLSRLSERLPRIYRGG